MNVTEDPLTKLVSKALGIEFSTASNADLKPTQKVATVAGSNGKLEQLDTTWGIKPSWAKKLLINAQSETVATKPTFRSSFLSKRCVVPVNGWYEWSATNGRKTKYLFEDKNHQPLYMAGIWYEPEAEGSFPKLVTLTTKPTEACSRYHTRMPLILPEELVGDWVLTKDINRIAAMLTLGGPAVCIKAA